MPSGQPKRVLVVEDNWFIAGVISDAIRAEGHHVIGPASCVADAEGLIALGAIDAALLDIELVDETTFDLARRLRAAGVPVVFNSGCDRRSMPADLADILLCAKPSDPSPLIAAVTGATGLR